jgi:phage gp36-like protein
MLTVVEFRNVLTEQEKALLSSDDGFFIDDSILAAVLDAAYEYVISFLRTAHPSVPWDKSTVPPTMDYHILTIAKYYLFSRRNLTSDALESAMSRTERFLRDLAAGKVSIDVPTADAERDLNAGFADRSNLAYDRVFLL